MRKSSIVFALAFTLALGTIAYTVCGQGTNKSMYDYLSLGDSYRSIGMKKETVAMYGMAGQNVPVDAGIGQYLAVGRAYLSVGDTETATQWYMNAMEKMGKTRDQYMTMGNAFKEINNLEQAESFFEMAGASAIRNQSVGGCISVGNAYRGLGNFQKAKLWYDNARNL